MGWLIALAVIAAVAVLPLGLRASYDGAGFRLKLIAGPFRFALFPGKKKEKKPDQEEPAQKQEKSGPSSQKQAAKGGGLTELLPLARWLWDLLGDLRRKLRVNRLEARLLLAGGDPCDLAVNYGRAVAAMSALDPQLERLFVIKKKNIRIECDFTEAQTQVWVNADLTITVGRILFLGSRHGLRIIREYLNIMKLRKGGAVK